MYIFLVICVNTFVYIYIYVSIYIHVSILSASLLHVSFDLYTSLLMNVHDSFDVSDTPANHAPTPTSILPPTPTYPLADHVHPIPPDPPLPTTLRWTTRS